MPPTDEGIDFSHSMDRINTPPPIDPINTSKPLLQLNRKVKIMLGVLGLLVLIQLLIFYYSRPPKTLETPNLQAPATSTK